MGVLRPRGLHLQRPWRDLDVLSVVVVVVVAAVADAVLLIGFGYMLISATLISMMMFVLALMFRWVDFACSCHSMLMVFEWNLFVPTEKRVYKPCEGHMSQ